MHPLLNRLCACSRCCFFCVFRNTSTLGTVDPNLTSQRGLSVELRMGESLCAYLLTIVSGLQERHLHGYPDCTHGEYRRESNSITSGWR
ncbi:hypothetical protein BJX63DRAFT_147407 [Aspergillus granulosus]|uniref:Secreted protein n=1 Tax=Aspergillus granulosus TaxID=176169 RepID=A0ABR4HKT4_9EURO